MTFRKKTSAKVMVPARWDPEGETAQTFYQLKLALQEKYSDSIITNDDVLAYLVRLGKDMLLGGTKKSEGKE